MPTQPTHLHRITLPDEPGGDLGEDDRWDWSSDLLSTKHTGPGHD